MKQQLSLRHRQNLAFNARFGGAIHMLQLPVADLNLEIRDALDSNPMLEETPHVAEESLGVDGAIGHADDVVSWTIDERPQASSDGLESIDASRPGSSIRDHVAEQLRFADFSPQRRRIAETAVAAIDERGYLAATNEEIHRNSALGPAVAESDIEAVIGVIQQCEPAGVGARDLTECLLIQVNAAEAPEPERRAAAHILEHHVDRLGDMDIDGIVSAMGVKSADVHKALSLIRKQNPAPGNGFGDDCLPLVPDVIVRKEDGRWQVELNEDVLPRIGISSAYRKMIVAGDRSKDNRYLENCFRSASVLLDNLKRRQVTMLRVSRQIVKHQEQFLEHGEMFMRPLKLNDIADALDLHESTVSRACARKFVTTPRGTFAMKRFFSPGLMGESATAVKSRLDALVKNEDRLAPLSDQQIAERLSRQGAQVARRTVAKYRSSLGIPPRHKRKILT